MTIDDLPRSWQKHILDLRSDCARYRTDLREGQAREKLLSVESIKHRQQRNAARAELAAMKLGTE